MERLLAHLERGWELMEDENFHDAEECADRALEIDPDHADALLLKAEALVCQGDKKGAKKMLERAIKQLEKTTKEDPDDPSSFYVLGCLYEELGDEKQMIRCWRRVRELDLKAPRPKWALSEAQFEKIAEKALAEVPERARELLANVPVMIADYPPEDVIDEGMDPRMMGFFSGVPYPEQTNIGGQPPHLEAIFLFQRNIERECETRAEMLEEIRTTVLHETGHFFGLEDDDLDDIGLG
jgi:predicted Zn-dependent protease with MMP-like domain